MPSPDYPETTSAAPSTSSTPNEDGRLADNVIDPIIRHVFSEGEAGPLIAKACYVFQLGQWRRDWRAAAEANDFYRLDYLDRQYELLGLP